MRMSWCWKLLCTNESVCACVFVQPIKNLTFLFILAVFATPQTCALPFLVKKSKLCSQTQTVLRLYNNVGPRSFYLNSFILNSLSLAMLPQVARLNGA